MQTVLAPRASTILCDLLLSRSDKRPFLLPANVCPVVPLTFLKAGVPFEFADISADSLHMDLGQAQKLLQRHEGAYGGLLYVHTYGDPSTPVEVFADIKAEHSDFLLIDDRCLCVPDLEPDPDNAADVCLYSSGYAKIVDVGFGGYAFLRDGPPYSHHCLPFDKAELEKLEKGYKLSIEAGTEYHYTNSDWLQTDAEMPNWPDYCARVEGELKASLARRKAINAIYEGMLPNELCLASKYQTWRFNLRVAEPRGVLEALFAAGLFASSHYASLAGIFGRGVDSNARELAAHVVNLFNDHHYSPEMAERTAEIVLRSL